MGTNKENYPAGSVLALQNFLLPMGEYPRYVWNFSGSRLHGIIVIVVVAVLVVVCQKDFLIFTTYLCSVWSLSPCYFHRKFISLDNFVMHTIFHLPGTETVVSSISCTGMVARNCKLKQLRDTINGLLRIYGYMLGGTLLF